MVLIIRQVAGLTLLAGALIALMSIDPIRLLWRLVNNVMATLFGGVML